jgi:RNA recognition motif-containing protein
MDARGETTGTVPARDRVIFVGGIPLATTLQTLRSYLSTFDKVEKIQLPRHKDSGVLKGYAKAVLATSEGVNRIVSHPEHVIGGLKVGIMQWIDQRTYLRKKDDEGERKVHVRFTDVHTERNLLRYFRRYGKVEDISIRTYPGTNISRNFCYITFESLVAAQATIDESPHLVANAYVHCELSIRPIYKHKPEKEQFMSLVQDQETSFERHKPQNKRLIPKGKKKEKLSSSEEKFPFDMDNERLFKEIELEILYKNAEVKAPQEVDFQLTKMRKLSSADEFRRKDLEVDGAAIHQLPAYHPIKNFSEEDRERERKLKEKKMQSGQYDDLIHSFIKPTSHKYDPSRRMLVSKNHYTKGNIHYNIRLPS